MSMLSTRQAGNQPENVKEADDSSNIHQVEEEEDGEEGLRANTPVEKTGEASETIKMRPRLLANGSDETLTETGLQPQFE